MLIQRLREVAGPVLEEVLAHPFWAGLRNGSLHGTALTHFVGQDTGHLLPALGRAFACCASWAVSDSHTQQLGLCAHATIESAPRLRAAFMGVAPSLGVDPVEDAMPADSTTLGYCSFLRAATASSLHAGIGAVLPMMWFHMVVCKDLEARSVAGSRYSPWIELYSPGERAWATTNEFLGMVDEIGGRASTASLDRLVEHFSVAASYELAFADSALSV